MQARTSLVPEVHSVPAGVVPTGNGQRKGIEREELSQGQTYEPASGPENQDPLGGTATISPPLVPLVIFQEKGGGGGLIPSASDSHRPVRTGIGKRGFMMASAESDCAIQIKKQILGGRRGL